MTLDINTCARRSIRPTRHHDLTDTDDRRRRQARLGRLTPIEYGTIMAPPVELAAKSNLSPKTGADPAVDRLFDK